MLAGLRGMVGSNGIAPGSQSYATPGTIQFEVPKYFELTVVVDGAGGGGAHNGYGTGGGASIFASNTPVRGEGGGGGAYYISAWVPVDVGGGNYQPFPVYSTVQGTNGAGSGGDTNTTSGGANGGTGSQANGGKGGKAVKKFRLGDPGSPTPGQTIAVTVGAKGVGTVTPDLDGSNGAVSISWT